MSFPMALHKPDGTPVWWANFKGNVMTPCCLPPLMATCKPSCLQAAGLQPCGVPAYIVLMRSVTFTQRTAWQSVTCWRAITFSDCLNIDCRGELHSLID